MSVRSGRLTGGYGSTPSARSRSILARRSSNSAATSGGSAAVLAILVLHILLVLN